MISISTIVPILQCKWDLNVIWTTLINVSSYAFSAIGEWWIILLFEQMYGCFGSKNKILPGGILFGKLSNIYGRKTVLSHAMVALFVSSSLSAMSQEAWQFVMLRCCVGLSMGVTFPTCVVYGAEIVKSRYRELGPLIATLVCNTSVFGVSLSAYLLLNFIEWRWFIIFNTMPIIACFILLRLVPESPRYLLVSKKYQEAKKALETIAKWNGKNLPSGFELQELEEEAIGSYSVVFSDQYRKYTVLLSIAGFSVLFILFGIIVFLPLALYSGFCGGNLKPQPQNCMKVEQSSLRDLSVVFCFRRVSICLFSFEPYKMEMVYNIQHNANNCMLYIATTGTGITPLSLGFQEIPRSKRSIKDDGKMEL